MRLIFAKIFESIISQANLKELLYRIKHYQKKIVLDIYQYIWHLFYSVMLREYKLLHND